MEKLQLQKLLVSSVITTIGKGESETLIGGTSSTFVTITRLTATQTIPAPLPMYFTNPRSGDFCSEGILGGCAG